MSPCVPMACAGDAYLYFKIHLTECFKMHKIVFLLLCQNDVVKLSKITS